VTNVVVTVRVTTQVTRFTFQNDYSTSTQTRTSYFTTVPSFSTRSLTGLSTVFGSTTRTRLLTTFEPTTSVTTIFTSTTIITQFQTFTDNAKTTTLTSLTTVVTYTLIIPSTITIQPVTTISTDETLTSTLEYLFPVGTSPVSTTYTLRGDQTFTFYGQGSPTLTVVPETVTVAGTVIVNDFTATTSIFID